MVLQALMIIARHHWDDIINRFLARTFFFKKNASKLGEDGENWEPDLMSCQLNAPLYTFSSSFMKQGTDGGLVLD